MRDLPQPHRRHGFVALLLRQRLPGDPLVDVGLFGLLHLRLGDPPEQGAALEEAALGLVEGHVLPRLEPPRHARLHRLRGLHRVASVESEVAHRHQLDHVAPGVDLSGVGRLAPLPGQHEGGPVVQLRRVVLVGSQGAEVRLEQHVVDHRLPLRPVLGVGAILAQVVQLVVEALVALHLPYELLDGLVRRHHGVQGAPDGVLLELRQGDLPVKEHQPGHPLLAQLARGLVGEVAAEAEAGEDVRAVGVRPLDGFDVNLDQVLEALDGAELADRRQGHAEARDVEVRRHVLGQRHKPGDVVEEVDGDGVLGAHVVDGLDVNLQGKQGLRVVVQDDVEDVVDGRGIVVRHLAEREAPLAPEGPRHVPLQRVGDVVLADAHLRQVLVHLLGVFGAQLERLALVLLQLVPPELRQDLLHR